jgi:hypothetical protein
MTLHDIVVQGGARGYDIFLTAAYRKPSHPHTPPCIIKIQCIAASTADLLTGKTSNSSRNRFDTDISASWGHSWNQFIAVQLMMAGNFRARTRKVDPTGEKHSTTFNWRRTRSMKNFQQFSRVSSIPAPFTYNKGRQLYNYQTCIRGTSNWFHMH